MKKLLTAFIVAFALAGSGQTPPLGRAHTNIDTIAAPKYDTIPIIYLYSDTTSKSSFGTPVKVVYWEEGYEVITDGDFIGYRVEPMTGITKPIYERKSLGYLDRGKQPLKKTMIIWQVKQIQ